MRHARGPKKNETAQNGTFEVRVDAASVYPTYRKPFDLIFLQTKNEEWRARGSDLRAFLRDFVSVLP